MRVPVPRLVPVAAALLLVAGCGGTSSEAPMQAAADKLAITNVFQAFNAALAAGDSAAVDSLYAADASVLPPGRPRVEGAAAVHRLWADMMVMPGFRLVLRPGPVTLARSGDLAAVAGVYRFEAAGPRGAVLRDTGKFVTVLTSRNGRWRILLDTWNGDAPPPAQGG